MVAIPRTSLRNHPEIAKNVGLVVADYAVLETFMAIVFVYLAGGNPKQAFERFYSRRSTHMKEELAMDAQWVLPKALKDAHERLWRRFKKAANRRTEIAHCIFFDNGSGPMRSRMIAGVMHYDKLTPKLFDHTFSQFHILGEDILAFAAIVGRLLGRDQHIVAQLPISLPDPARSESKRSPDPPTQEETNLTVEAIRRLGLADHYQLDLLEAHGKIPPAPAKSEKR